ncbi:hypothetical protein VNO77_31597 [Canavalia gladiata]|uniref:Uncharacterized protein n=1 Tax=Canavalia gladiata TaxID=3824 RepID=A0AAN9KR43_CANGL
MCLCQVPDSILPCKTDHGKVTDRHSSTLRKAKPKHIHPLLLSCSSTSIHPHTVAHTLRQVFIGRVNFSAAHSSTISCFLLSFP